MGVELCFMTRVLILSEQQALHTLLLAFLHCKARSNHMHCVHLLKTGIWLISQEIL